jgi:DNA-binding LytR/AlgR family response regulator
MNVIIVEDEELAALRLESLLYKSIIDIHVLAKLESVKDAVNWLSTHEDPDLIFMDIHLEDGLSFSIFERVKVNAPIIFTTAFDDYAIKAFKLKSIDYLLKPVVQEELNNSLLKYKEWIGEKNSRVDVNALYDIFHKKETVYKTRFSITAGQKLRTFSIDEIAYFFAESGLVFMVTHSQGKFPIDYTMEQLTLQLNPNDFFRINRQYLVKLSAISQVHVYPKSKLKVDLLPMNGKQEVFVSLDKVTAFKSWLDS